ncbi:MAG: invasion associated locus B family protein [Alphaproteobacteria bacterium]
MAKSVLAASVLGAVLLAAPSGAATNPKTEAAKGPQQTTAETREQGWRAQCTSASRDSKPNCAANKRVVLANTGQLLAAITIRVPPKTRKPVMMLHAPLGLYLPPGMSVAVGKEKPLTVPLQTCDNNGCYAGQPMPADLLEKFRKGEKLVLSFQDLSRQEIEVNISLKGFAEAYDKVK